MPCGDGSEVSSEWWLGQSMYRVGWDKTAERAPAHHPLLHKMVDDGDRVGGPGDPLRGCPSFGELAPPYD